MDKLTNRMHYTEAVKCVSYPRPLACHCSGTPPEVWSVAAGPLSVLVNVRCNKRILVRSRTYLSEVKPLPLSLPHRVRLGTLLRSSLVTQLDDPVQRATTSRALLGCHIKTSWRSQIE